jgi:hypothetical protein
MDPDRILLLGNGVATGRGVTTHDLGLPGHLARSLSAETGRATDVDIVVSQGMTVLSSAAAITGVDLFRYDIIILSVGHNEALRLMSADVWRAGLRILLTKLRDQAPAATKIFLLSIPMFGPRTAFPTVLAQVVDKHARALNAVTQELVEEVPNITLIPVNDANEFEPETRHLYRQWADGIATRISEDLDPDRIPVGDTAMADEEGRQRALEVVEEFGPDADPVLDGIADSARRTFGMPIGAITFIHSDFQKMVAASGMTPLVIARDQALCDITIRRSAHLIIEDAANDSRQAHFSVVEGAPCVRFYAGYPIESPDGYRIGALCVMDIKPRHFSRRDIEILRAFAGAAQDHLRQRVHP